MDIKKINKNNFSIQEIIKITSEILKQIIKYNQNLVVDNSNFTTFDSETLLKTNSINEYLTRIVFYLKLTSEMIILSLMYIDQFIKMNKDFTLNHINCHK